jgi:pyruvate kinase
VIWATQVLDTMARRGMPSRAEVSDAALAVRAECVMLNKGPYIVDTVRFLDDILGRMAEHRAKGRPMMRRLAVSDIETPPVGFTGLDTPARMPDRA